LRWYKGATVCYALLTDVGPRLSKSPARPDALKDKEWRELFSKSTWFKRGWTLQELVAPSNVVFFSSKWTELGTKLELANAISDVTRIPYHVLRDNDIFSASVACRMSWAANRQTTRIEDMAYCLLGIFDISLPLL
jgi:hypothetical protein